MNDQAITEAMLSALGRAVIAHPEDSDLVALRDLAERKRRAWNQAAELEELGRFAFDGWRQAEHVLDLIVRSAKERNGRWFVALTRVQVEDARSLVAAMRSMLRRFMLVRGEGLEVPACEVTPMSPGGTLIDWLRSRAAAILAGVESDIRRRAS